MEVRTLAAREFSWLTASPSPKPSLGSLTYRGGRSVLCESALGQSNSLRSSFLEGKHHIVAKTRNCGFRRGPRNAKVMMNLGGSDEADVEEYVEAHVMDAVRMVPARNQLFMTMANGAEVEVVHVNPTAGRLLYQSGTPTIFLKMGDKSDLMLPIVVGELAIGLLMKAFRSEQTARPNCYDLMKDMVESLGHEVRMVKVTQRIVDTYYARIYIARPGEDKVSSIDARPSDAINLAVRCQVPIFVSKSIVSNDSVKVAYAPVYETVHTPRSVRSMGPAKDALLDSPLSEHDLVAEEICLVKSMMAAVTEERYSDAAQIRDELTTLRQRTRRQLNKH